MALRKKDLENLYASYNLPIDILAKTGRGGQSASRDYISALALLSEVRKANPTFDFSKVTDPKELWATLSPATRFRLRSYTPMLAFRYDELKPQEQSALFTSHDWLFTTKENGCRGWLIVTPSEFRLFSRNYSDTDCGLLEYSDHFHAPTLPNEVFAIDVEIKFEPGADISKDLATLGLQTDSPLEALVALLHTYPQAALDIQDRFFQLHNKPLLAFRLIAPLYFHGKNYLQRTLGEAHEVYDQVVEYGRSLGINLKAIERCNGTKEEKELFLNSIITSGGEGVVAHNLKSGYVTSENRSRTGFVKIKRTIQATADSKGLGDTIDGFVSGFTLGTVGTANEGIIGGLEFSIYLDNGHQHHIASVPGISREERLLATWNNAEGLYPQSYIGSDNQEHWISLNPDFDGLVAELSGQALSSKSQRLEHPRMIMWRTERSPESCIYSREWLRANTTGQGITYA